MTTTSLLLAYFGPETVLPATSIIATVVGVFLMLGRNSIRWTWSIIRGAWRVITRQTDVEADQMIPSPHFQQSSAQVREAEDAAR